MWVNVSTDTFKSQLHKFYSYNYTYTSSPWAISTHQLCNHSDHLSIDLKPVFVAKLTHQCRLTQAHVSQMILLRNDVTALAECVSQFVKCDAMTCSPYRAHTKPLFYANKVLNVCGTNSYTIVIFMYQFNLWMEISLISSIDQVSL